VTARAQSRKTKPQPRGHTLRSAGVTMVATLSGALFWKSRSSSWSPNLHLEKGSRFCHARRMLPPRYRGDIAGLRR